MSDKDSITFDDIEIDLSSYGAAQASTITDTLDTITLSPSTYSVDLSSMSTGTITLPSSSTYYSPGATVGGINSINNINSTWHTGTTGTSGQYYTVGTNGNNWNSPSTINISNTGIDMAAGTDIKVDGKSLKEFMTKMEQRLSILVPDPEKLEKFEALKRAYEHYKTMESLCFPDEKDTKE
jgi:hypothetical protein